jgi:hypothetical protein
MKSLIPTGQDYIGSGAWYESQNTTDPCTFAGVGVR